jgi:hypothetical protein
MCAVVTLGWLAMDVATGAETERQAEAQRLTQRLEEMRARLVAAPSDAAAALDVSRACFALAEFATQATQRASLAEEGMAAARMVLAATPTNANAQIALGQNLGQLARTRTLGALKLVPQMEAAWLAAVAADPRAQYAAPHRLLGLLYNAAPSWPISVGNHALARTNFAQAVALAPEYPDNWLVYLEACLGWEDLKTARTLVPKTTVAMAQARQRFAGPDWSWRVRLWEQHWTTAQKKFETAEKRARNATHRQRMKDD